MQTEEVLPEGQIVFHGFIPSKIDDDFAQFMKNLSQTSQEYSSAVHPHGPREFLTATMLALDKACKDAHVDFLFPCIQNSIFAVDKQGRFVEHNLVKIWNSLKPLADEQRKDELLEKIQKPSQAIEVFIQLWLEKHASIIKQVLSESCLKTAVFPDVDIVKILTEDEEFWNAFFKPAFSDKEKIDFGYFFTNKKSTLAYMIEHQSSNYDNIIYNKHAIEMVQLLLWSRLSRPTLDTLRSALSDHKCKSDQLESKNPIATKAITYRWISCMVQSIASSVYFSKSVWTKSGLLNTKHTKLYLPDEVYNFSLLLSSIATNVKFFVSHGPNPVGAWYFKEKQVQGEHYDFLSFVTRCHTHNMDTFCKTLLSRNDSRKLCIDLITKTLAVDCKKRAKQLLKERSMDNITQFFVTIVHPPDEVAFTTSICQYRGTPLFLDHDTLFEKYSKNGTHDADADADAVVVAAINEAVPDPEEQSCVSLPSHDNSEERCVSLPSHDADTVQSQGNDDHTSVQIPDISVADGKKLKKLMKEVRTLLPEKHMLVDISGEIGKEVHRLVETLVPTEKKRKKEKHNP